MYNKQDTLLKQLFEEHLPEAKETPIDETLPIYTDALENTIATWDSETSVEDIAGNFILGSKVFSKLKRTDPSKKIIDAYDIDWSGYKVNVFNRNNEYTGEDFIFRPQNTYELLDLIFRMLQFLYEKYKIFGEENVMWNDTGLQRSYKHRLFWVDTLYTITMPDTSETTTLWDAIISFRKKIQELEDDNKNILDDECQVYVKQIEALIDDFTGDIYWNPTDRPIISTTGYPSTAL